MKLNTHRICTARYDWVLLEIDDPPSIKLIEMNDAYPHGSLQIIFDYPKEDFQKVYECLRDNFYEVANLKTEAQDDKIK